MDSVKQLVPTIIPAQPGFRLAGFGCDDPKTAKPEGLVPWFEVIIVTRGQSRGELNGASVEPVVATGTIGGHIFIVDPLGQWLDLGATYTEAEARQAWLLAERRSATDTLKG